MGITGSPGTGKQSVGRELSKLIALPYFSINDYAIKSHLGKWENGEYVVSPQKLKGKINTRNKIVCGHLLPYVIPDPEIDFVAILRCSPKVLGDRYRFRDYSESKIRENLEAEMIGLISAKCVQEYRISKLAEFDTTRSKAPMTIAKRILYTIREKKKASLGDIDWLSKAATAGALEKALKPENHRFNRTKKDN